MAWIDFLRWAHVIGATVLLGTGAGIAFFMVMAHRTLYFYRTILAPRCLDSTQNAQPRAHGSPNKQPPAAAIL